MADERRLKESVKDWYCEVFDNDPCGPDLPDTLGEVHGDFFAYDIEENPDLAEAPVTFGDYMLVLDNYGDVYDLMGDAADSIVRERIFEELAEIIGEDYDYIYQQWLRCS